jgi:hypothetical protein
MIDEAVVELASTHTHAPKNNLTPLFITHGNLDTTIPLTKAKQHVCTSSPSLLSSSSPLGGSSDISLLILYSANVLLVRTPCTP